MGYGGGRNYALDFRDVKVPRGALAPAGNPSLPRARRHKTGPIFDQGDSDHCVIYTIKQLALSEPVAQSLPRSVLDLFNHCQRIDEWKDQPGHFGTSGRAAMKVLRHDGFLSNYWFVQSAEDVVRWVLSRGPVCLGVMWFDGMMKPDGSAAWIQPSGYPVFGHEVLITGADRDMHCPDTSRGAVEITNSWGESWGNGGKAHLSFIDLDWLLKNHGDAIVPTETWKG